MTRKDITIAILENDNLFSKEAKDAIEKEGFSVVLYSDYEALLATLKLRKIDFFIIECLTQKKSLPEVIELILKTLSEPAHFLFVSMILDKTSIVDVLKKTKSENFFKKPVALSEIIKVIKDKFKDVHTEDVDLFMDVLHKNQITNQERFKAIKSLVTIHGFETIRIFSMIYKNLWSGTLQLKTENKTFKVSFFKGQVCKVEVDDPKSYFGAILVDKGFVSLEEMETVLQQKSSKRIGERLVDANLISPHVIDIVNVEQMGIRLGFVVQDAIYEVAVDETEVQDKSVIMDNNTLLRFSGEWLNSKVTLKWLKNYFLPFLNMKVLKSKNYQDISSVHHIEPLNRLKSFAQELFKDRSLSAFIDSKVYLEEDIYRAIYLLLLNEFAFVEKQVRAQNTALNLERLKRIKVEMDSQTHFEILGLNDKAKSREIKKAYYDLSKIFHPDKVASSGSQEIKDLTQYIFAKISKAHEVLSDDNLRAQYLKEFQKGNAEKILESESLFEEAKSYMKTSQPQKALDLIQQAMSMRPPTSELKLYSLWNKILITPSSNSETYLFEIEAELNHIPPEDRHNSTYYFIKGLFSKVRGDYDTAEKHVKHALSMSPQFVEAKRELNIIELLKKNNPNKQVDILNADLKDVVGMLFKKKK